MFKKKTYIIVSFLLVLIFMTIGCNSTNTTKNADKFETLNVSYLPVSGSNGTFNQLRLKETVSFNCLKTAPVYKVVGNEITFNEARNIANSFQFEDNIKEADMDYSVNSENGSLFIQKKTGSFRYISRKMGETKLKPITNKMTDEEYINKAYNFLYQNNLINEDINEDGIVNREKMYDLIPSTGEKQVKMISVDFYHKNLDNIRILGVIPRISVMFGNKGEIVGCLSNINKYKKYEDYPLIPLDKAISKAVNGNALISNLSKNDTGIIENVEIVYFNFPNSYDEDYLTPCYLLEGKNSNNEEFTIYVYAVEDEYINLVKPNNSSSESDIQVRPEKEDDPEGRRKAMEESLNKPENTIEIEQNGALNKE